VYVGLSKPLLWLEGGVDLHIFFWQMATPSAAATMAMEAPRTEGITTLEVEASESAG
jgi:hypothetical protein